MMWHHFKTSCPKVDVFYSQALPASHSLNISYCLNLLTAARSPSYVHFVLTVRLSFGGHFERLPLLRAKWRETPVKVK